jgi:hypothetical protein
MGLPAFPGPGGYVISLDTPGFFVLVTLLFLFGGMLVLLHRRYPGRKRGLEGYFEAAGIDLAFLVSGCAVAVLLALHDPSGNRTSRALYDVIVGGYWFSFSIPVVTVGSSVEGRSRGKIPWRIPSVLVAVGMFGVLFAYYFSAI